MIFRFSHQLLGLLYIGSTFHFVRGVRDRQVEDSTHRVFDQLRAEAKLPRLQYKKYRPDDCYVNDDTSDSAFTSLTQGSGYCGSPVMTAFFVLAKPNGASPTLARIAKLNLEANEYRVRGCFVRTKVHPEGAYYVTIFEEQSGFAHGMKSMVGHLAGCD